jgi:hypothetical protein
MNATSHLDTTNQSSDLRELSVAEIAEIGGAGNYEDFPVIPR